MPNAKASKKLEHDRRDNCGMDPRAASSARQGGFSRLGPSLCLALWGGMCQNQELRGQEHPREGGPAGGPLRGDNKHSPQGLQGTLSDVLQPKGEGSTARTWQCHVGLGHSTKE